MKFLKISFYPVIFLSLILLTQPGCDLAKPLPPDKADYAGQWEGELVKLSITPDGMAVYERQGKGNMKTTVSGPISKFEGDNFTVGFWFMATAFEVSQPPIEEGNRWTMTVDDVDLYKESDS